ncbi:probable endonuclease G, mitochondrial precursor [Ramularia collo-cygni]|uniref:Endonuclease n=1 Tax=Ramularia collo-cygni TaxID=112498 RepID=A0A2D3V3N0_9PEZI|nr:probable endonuclease G, mitochondrial precursor [Ramularia collo-cygni]CZT24887.1 probable endonuclease G, mitochondrial precursor [Ramularia collo-cygni]
MSKFTLAVVAGTSAAIGAATTAAVYGLSKRNETIAPTTTTTPTPTAPSRTGPLAPAPVGFPRESSLPIPPPVDPAGLFQYGFPGPVSDLRNAPSLTSAYNRATRNPHWVAEHITPASLLMQNGDRRHSQFVEDMEIPEKFRAKLKDYFRSGYDRGHQVPAADAKWSQEAMNSTFALSNMCPQVGEGFNRDYWAHLEDFCRRLTSFYPSVRIVTGPLYLPKREADGKWRVSYEVVGHPPNVAVPTHFYKVVFAEDGKTGGAVSLAAFVLPNDRIPNDKPLQDFEVPIEAVERASGLEFASLLPPARRKQLCKEVNCSVIIKEYAQRQKTMTSPAPQKGTPPATTLTQR